MPKCLYCDEPLSLIDCLWDQQFCTEEHRRSYMRESRWHGVPLRVGETPRLCPVLKYTPANEPLEWGHGQPPAKPAPFAKREYCWPAMTPCPAPRFAPGEPFPLPMPGIRTAPRRRFVYGWGNQAIVRGMLKEAAARLEMPRAVGRIPICDPTGETIAMEIGPLPLAGGGTNLPFQAFEGLDESALEAIPAGGFIRSQMSLSSFPQMPAVGSPASPQPCVQPLKTETPLAPIESTRVLRGVFIPQVSLPLLRPRIAFAPRAGGARSGDRQSSIIAISDFQPAERKEPLARTS
ncbi:MAG: hypothetical protein IANPNBLG_04464 [Bryobacteraceae bacterium]|nr:hypothetical protein [Bryobacteraceae bacterium]